MLLGWTGSGTMGMVEGEETGLDLIVSPERIIFGCFMLCKWIERKIAEKNCLLSPVIQNSCGLKNV